ncbi:hypothetical protein KR222_003510, partial [Zaprionus bogoriensis]
TGAPWFTRNQTLRIVYDIDTAEEIYHKSSKRLATTLANHPNPVARQLILEPYTPQRLHRPSYQQQL